MRYRDLKACNLLPVFGKNSKEANESSKPVATIIFTAKAANDFFFCFIVILMVDSRVYVCNRLHIFYASVRIFPLMSSKPRLLNVFKFTASKLS